MTEFPIFLLSQMRPLWAPRTTPILLYVHPSIFQAAMVHHDHGGRDIDYAWATNMNLHLPRLILIYTLLTAQSASSRDQQWAPNMAPYPRVVSQLASGWLIILVCFSWRKATSVCTQIDIYSGYVSSSPTFLKPIFVDLENYLSTILVFHTASLINKELILRAHAHGIYCFYYLPHHPEVVVSKKQLNDLLKP